MGKFNSFVCAAALCAGAAGVSPALGAEGVLGQYQELAATYDAATGELDIFAVNRPDLASWGFVSEMAGAGHAQFAAGFVAEPNPATFEASLVLTNIGENSGIVSGEVRITDVDGDTIAMGFEDHVVLFGQGDANVIGITWWVGCESDEGLFDGSDGGQVSTNFPLESAMFSVFVVREPRKGESLFHGSFTDGRASALFAIPAPGAALPFAVGCAGMAALRRRRS